MKKTSVFTHKSYRDYLKIKAEEADSNWGALTRLAKAAGCHRPYLSKVLAEEAHLTSSQLYALAKYWNLTEAQTEYLMRLLEIEKASRAEYREYLVQKNTELKRREENLSQVVSRRTSDLNVKDTLYYSSWIWSMVHVLTSVPQFQTPKAISERLSIPIVQIESILSSLESWGSVRQDKGRWKFAADEHHISKQSPLSTFHHSNWRAQAVLNSQRQLPDSLHFTVVQSVSSDDFERLREMVLEFLRAIAKVAGPSREEKVYALNCDFFEP
jgi:uncharacterized protein (TIGR02147 family)